MRSTRHSLCEKLEIHSNPEPCGENEDLAQHDWREEEPWTAILVEELARSFREFARQSGRLARLAQRKRLCSIPSEGFNLLLAQRIERMEGAFLTYMRRKNELMTHLGATLIGRARQPALEACRRLLALGLTGQLRMYSCTVLNCPPPLLRDVRTEPMGWNFHLTPHSLGKVHQSSGAAKLIGYQLTNYAGAEARSCRANHVWPTALLPLNPKPALRMSVSPKVPAHGHVARSPRQCTELRRVGSELVENHGQSLTRLGT